MILLPHQQRVVDERHELDAKFQALEHFINTSDVFKALPSEDQLLLNMQYSIMNIYLGILFRRIERF